MFPPAASPHYKNGVLNINKIAKSLCDGYSNDSDNEDVVFQVLGLPCTIVSKISVS